jgi:hypothetical protein
MRRWRRRSKSDRHCEAAYPLRRGTGKFAVIRSSRYVRPGLVVSVHEFAV